MNHLLPFNEKLGYNKEVSEFSKKIFNIVKEKIKLLKYGKAKYETVEAIINSKESYPVQAYVSVLDIDRLFGKKIGTFNLIITKRTDIKKLYREGKYKLALKYSSITTPRIVIKYKDGKYNVNLILISDNIKISMINHEIMHLFQKIKSPSIKNEYKGMLPLYGLPLLGEFRKLVYLTTEQEMNARIQDFYISMLKDGVKKSTFLDYIKNNQPYNYTCIDEMSDYIKMLKKILNDKDETVEFVNDVLEKTGKRPLPPNQAEIFLKKKIKFFEKQARKYHKKLIKTYDLLPD